MARILVVDDEAYIRDLIREALLAQGYEFVLAANGTEALEALRKNSVDLAIIDRNMPGITGIQVLQLIRQNPKTKSLKVLICTAASMTMEIDEAFAAGADDYILKPLSFPMLLNKVAKALASPPR